MELKAEKSTNEAETSVHQHNALHGEKNPEASHKWSSKPRNLQRRSPCRSFTTLAMLNFHHISPSQLVITGSSQDKDHITLAHPPRESWIKSRQDPRESRIKSRQNPRPTQAAGLKACNGEHDPVKDNRQEQEGFAAEGVHCCFSDEQLHVLLQDVKKQAFEYWSRHREGGRRGKERYRGRMQRSKGFIFGTSPAKKSIRKKLVPRSWARKRRGGGKSSSTLNGSTVQ